MNFKKRMISLLIAVLLLFNNIPFGRATVGNLSIVGADTIGVEGALKMAVTDVTYGWDGRNYRFPSSILATVEAGHEVYLVADTAVEGFDDGIPKVSDEAVTVTFTNFRLAGSDAERYIVTELADLISFSTEIKILPKTLWIVPAMTGAFYGQDLPKNGEVTTVSDEYKNQLVNAEEEVVVDCTFTFALNGAVDPGVYALENIGDIKLSGKDSGNYLAEVADQDNLAFTIAAYDPDVAAVDPDVPASEDGNGHIHNGKKDAHLVAPDSFLISTTGDLNGEWHEEIMVDLEETEDGEFKTVTYYLRNNDQSAPEYRAVCQKDYSYTAMPMPIVTGIELVPLFEEKDVDGVPTNVQTTVLEKDGILYANGDMQVVVYVSGASYQQETEVILSVNGEENIKSAEEALQVDGRYIYKATFDIATEKGETKSYELKAYAKNSSGTGDTYPDENCQDTYMGYETLVTKPLVVDRKGPIVDITDIRVVYGFGAGVIGDFTVSDENVGIDKVEYAWDGAAYQVYKNYQETQREYTSFLSIWSAEDVAGGLHTLHLRVTDALGNVTEIAEKDTIGVDQLAPEVISVDIQPSDGAAFQNTKNGIFSNGAVTVVVRAKDMTNEVNATSNLGDSSVMILVGDTSYTMTRVETSEDSVEHTYELVIDPNDKDVKWKNIRIKVKDNAGNEIAPYLKEITQSDGAAKYLSNNLYVEKAKPVIEISKLGTGYEKNNEVEYCVGAGHIGKTITVTIKDMPEAECSGVKSVKITRTNGEETINVDTWSAGLPEIQCPTPHEIDVSSWKDGAWTINVETEDFCGNTHTESFSFKKDVTAPESGEIMLDTDNDQDCIDNVKELDEEEWFAPESTAENKKDGYISFLIGSKSADEKLSAIKVSINGNEKTIIRGDQKLWQENENGGSYICADTKNWIRGGIRPNAPTGDIPYNHYIVEAELVDKHMNSVKLERKIIYVDKANPRIEKVTVVQADESFVDQIIRILSFGIFTNNDVVFKVYTKDGVGDSGMKSVHMKVKNTGKEIIADKGIVNDEGFTVYSFTVSKGDLEKYEGFLAFSAYDQYGKVCTMYPYIKPNEKYKVVIERELPGIAFDLPKPTGFYEERKDGQFWYNTDKHLSLRVADTHSGIYSITLLVNGYKGDLFKEPNGIVKNQLFTPQKEAGVERNRFDQYFTLYNLEKAVNSAAVPGKNGEYRIAIKVADNSGNVYSEEQVYYIDTDKPTVDKITFSTAAVGGIQEISGRDILINDKNRPVPLHYGYFFQKDFDITLHVSDQGPSSGLHHVDYWFYNVKGDPQKAKISDGKAQIDVPNDFKGMIYYQVWDMAGNCSEVMTTNGFVVDNAAPTIEIQPDDVKTNCKDAVGNPLYTQTKTFTVTITDSVSGLNQFSYLKNAELHPTELKGITIDKDGKYAVSGEVNDGWKIVSMDANLVTKVTKTFTFAEDDNDIQMSFNAKDWAACVANTKDSDVFTIDKTAPKILVDFGSDNDDDKYYNQNRTATITVTERNFDESLIVAEIKNTFGSVPGYTFRHDANDNTKHTATINFDQGDYTFDLTGMDMGNHEAVVTFTGGNEKLFYVDKTAPVVTDNFREFANEHENSFNTDKTATITIVEHNFDPNLTNLRITRKAAGGEHSHNGMVDVTNEILGGRTWSKIVDTYSISFTFSEDAVYYVEIAPVDLASNRGTQNNTVIFEIDKTVPVVSAKNGMAVAPDATELLDIYPYDRRNSAAPTVTFSDNNIVGIEYTFITYIPKYMREGLTVVEPHIESGTVLGNLFTLKDFTRDGIYSLELVAVDVAGNRSEINYNTYARMVSQDVLAFILDSNVKQQTGLFSLEYEDGESISKKPDDFMDLRILVMTPAETPIDIVLRDTNGKETMTMAGLSSLESVYGVNVHTFALSADFFRENFQNDIDTEMHLTVRNEGSRIDLARIHIDSIEPTCNVPEELKKWAWFIGEEDRVFTITNISEKLEEANCRVYDNGEMIPFVYSAEDSTLTFTLSKGWHNVGFILSDAAGNANIGQEVCNIHIGYFWCYFIVAGFAVLAVSVATLYLYRRRRALQEMMDEA